MTKHLFALLMVSAVACSSTNGNSGSGGSKGGGGTSATGSGGAASGSGGASSGTGGQASGGVVGTGGTATTGSGGSAGRNGAGSGGVAQSGGTTGGGGRAGATGGTAGGGRSGGGSNGSAGSSASGSGGAMSSGGAGGSLPGDTSNSVLERNKHPSRDGHFIQPTLTKAMAATMAPDADFKATFTGNTWASPVFLEKGPGGKGLFFAVTYDNNVFALDETTGAVVWMKNIGAPATGNIGCGLGGSTPSPLGILSTPVIDEASGTIYVAGAIGGAQGTTANILTALDVMTGAVKTGWPVDLTAKVGAANFDPKIHIQRSALSLVNGIVYVAYGGFVGDCGNYHGRVVAVKASDPTQVASWAAGGQAEGIWPAGGLASDGKDIFAVTGNVMPRTGTRVDSESVFRVSGMATVTKTDAKNFFTPSTAAAMDSSDADMSSSNTVYFSVPGATPSNFVTAFSKDGNMFMLDAANLGGTGKPAAQLMLSSGSMSLYAIPTVYTTPTGVFMAVATDGGAKCPTGGGRSLMGISIPAGSPPVPTVSWCATVSGGTAAISTTTDGKTDAIVWILSGSKLYGYDGATGTAIFSGGTGTCANVRKWTSPIAVKGRIVVMGDGHMCSWSPH